MNTGTLYIVAAPSGAGKTSLVAALVKQVERLVVSVSYTTRARRPGEQDGVNYHFIDEAHFKQHIADDAFLEYAQVFDRYYGTGKDWVERKLASGRDVILEIDWQGARQIRKAFPECVSIFIFPPSIDVLEQRLRARQQDNDATIARRMQDARKELQHHDEFQYLVLNDDFQQALTALASIVQAQRLRCATQAKKHADLLTQWH